MHAYADLKALVQAEAVQQNALGMLIVVGILVVAGAAYIAWERFDERRKGIA